MTKKILQIVIILQISLVVKLSAQQLPLFSQYMFNTFLINPAAAGLEGYTTINLTAREQWVGFADAPKTHVLSVQTRLLNDNFITRIMPVRRRPQKGSQNGRVGLGFNIYNDQNGIVNRNGMQATYAYHLPLYEAEMSFGITASFYQFSIDRSKINIEDNQINNTKLSMLTPDFNFGVLYTKKEYHAGITISQLSHAYFQFGNHTTNEFRQLTEFDIMGGYRFEINRDYSIEPSALIKTTSLWRPQMDIGAKVFYMNDYWGGISFRTGAAMVIMAGLSVDKYHFGYAFDYNFNNIQSQTFGTHEFMVAVKFGDNARRFRWLHRY